MILGHGVGSRGDLPLPLWMFIWASAAAIMVSFLALGLLWTRPRLATAARGLQLSGRRNAENGAGGPGLGLVSVLRVIGKVVALALFLLALWAGLFGSNQTDANLLPVTLYVIVWVGAQLVSGLVGDVWREISPLLTIAIGLEWLMGRLGRPTVAPPVAPGHWPAAAGLLVFLFYELAHPSGSAPRTLGWMLAVHTAVSLALAARWGAAWIAENEPFAVLFTALSAMAVLGRQDGGIALRAPMTGLARYPVLPGTTAALLIVLGGTTFDGFSESATGRDLLGRPSGWGGALTLTFGLVVSMVIISLFFVIGVWWTARVTGLGRAETATAFTPSLIPIVFGYAIAHYAQLLVDESQRFVFQLSDPGGLGWNLFGGADGEIDFNIVSVDLVAWIQVLAILFGHVGAVVVAHDRSIELFKAGESLRSQFVMLLVMVAYSTLGLWLLLNS